LAAQHGHAQTAEVLLRAGVSRDARTKVLHFFDVIKFLLAARNYLHVKASLFEFKTLCFCSVFDAQYSIKIINNK